MEFNADIAYSKAVERISSEDDSSDLLKIKLAELEKMNEELKQAKDDAMQSWLDSRPLVDELEKMQAELESAKARVLKADTVISELQAQLGTTDMCIKSSKEEEQKFCVIINAHDQALHKAQEEMEQLKLKIDKKRRQRSNLKLVLRSKRQNLRTLQLSYEAMQLESEAFRSSAAQALGYINNSEAANVMMQIHRGEYEFLKKEANEQNLQSEQRISIAEEERVAAEHSRYVAFRRMQNLYHVSGMRNAAEKRTRNGTTTEKIEETGETDGGRTNRGCFSKSRPKQTAGVNRMNSQQQFKSSISGRQRKLSVFVRIKTFFVHKLSKYF